MKQVSHARGFVCLNVCQFFTAANDNILKQVLIFGVAAGGIWSGILGDGAQAYASLCLSIPFVLFSGFAGQFADRYSKRDVCLVVKWAEAGIALIAMLGFWQANVWIVLFAMVLISIQSTFFTPAKFGILPEIIEAPELSRANGTMNMFTYIAVILGSAIGGPIYDAYAPDAGLRPNVEPSLWLPGMIVLVVAALGVASALGIPRLKAQNPHVRIRLQFFRTYIATWRDIAGSPVAAVIIAWSWFYLIVGGIAILILPDYRLLLNISATKTALLMALLGVSIGVGDFVAGRASGHRIRPELIPVGAIGTTVLFFLLAVIPLDFNLVCASLAMAGFLAGFVMVPLQTMTQQFSAADERGQVLGLWNCLSFVGIIVGNLIFLAFKSMGMPSNHVFFVCGVLGLIFVAMYYATWRTIFLRPLPSMAHRSRRAAGPARFGQAVGVAGSRASPPPPNIAGGVFQPVRISSAF